MGDPAGPWTLRRLAGLAGVERCTISRWAELASRDCAALREKRHGIRESWKALEFTSEEARQILLAGGREGLLEQPKVPQ